MRECVNILKQFANISGLQCNLEKTSVIPIGGNFDTSDKLCPELSLKWESEFTLLGFQIDSRLNNYDVNYQKCFERVHAISRKWARYQISLKGICCHKFPLSGKLIPGPFPTNSMHTFEAFFIIDIKVI